VRSGRCVNGRASCDDQQDRRSRGSVGGREWDRPSASLAAGAAGRNSGPGAGRDTWQGQRRAAAGDCPPRTKRKTRSEAGQGAARRSGSVGVGGRARGGAGGPHAGTGAGAAPSRPPTSQSVSVSRDIVPAHLGCSRTRSWCCRCPQSNHPLYSPLRCHVKVTRLCGPVIASATPGLPSFRNIFCHASHCHCATLARLSFTRLSCFSHMPSLHLAAPPTSSSPQYLIIKSRAPINNSPRDASLLQ